MIALCQWMFSCLHPVQVDEWCSQRSQESTDNGRQPLWLRQLAGDAQVDKVQMVDSAQEGVEVHMLKNQGIKTQENV